MLEADQGNREMQLHITEHGDRGAPPVVLLHALSKDGTDWHHVASALAHTHFVVAPDLRGHGRSDHPGEYSFELMRDDVISVIEPLGPVALVGHSMGGSVAYRVIAARPDLVSRLVIEDTPPPLPQEMEDPPEEPPFEVDFDWEVLRQLGREFRDPDPAWWDDLRSIAVPTLVIGGGEESDIPQDRLAEVADAIPGSRFVSLGGGHFVHEANPAEYVALVSDFLSSGL